MTDPLSYLFGLGQFGVKFGLDNMRAIVSRLGHPERIAGTLYHEGRDSDTVELGLAGLARLGPARCVQRKGQAEHGQRAGVRRRAGACCVGGAIFQD